MYLHWKFQLLCITSHQYFKTFCCRWCFIYFIRNDKNRQRKYDQLKSFVHLTQAFLICCNFNTFSPLAVFQSYIFKILSVIFFSDFYLTLNITLSCVFNRSTGNIRLPIAMDMLTLATGLLNNNHIVSLVFRTILWLTSITLRGAIKLMIYLQ